MNPAWMQAHPPTLATMKERFHASQLPAIPVVWWSSSVFRHAQTRTISLWFRDHYDGKRQDTVLTEYEMMNSVIFKSTVARESVHALAIAELNTPIGRFTLRTTGKLSFLTSNGKSTIQFYCYYLGPKKGCMFLVKPSHKEKIAGITSDWNSIHKAQLQTALKKMGNVFAFYRQVLDQCAEVGVNGQ